MLRNIAGLAAMWVLAIHLQTVSAQDTTGSVPSRMRLTIEKLNEMKAKWSANRPKLKACRKEVRRKGLAGDDRWFYIEDCMSRG